MAWALLSAAPVHAQIVSLGAPGTQVPAGNVQAGTVGTSVAAFTLRASSGTVAVESLGLTNVGSPAAQPGLDVHSLQLHEGATYLGSARWDGAKYSAHLPGLLVGTTVRTITVKLAAATGASLSRKVRLQIVPADVTVATGSTAGEAVTANEFGFTGGALEGSAAAGTTRPVVALVTPGNGASLSCGSAPSDAGCRVQVRVTSGTALDSVRLSTDGAATWPLALAFKAAYGGTPNSGIYEGVLRIAPGAYALRAEATNAAGQVLSAPAIVVVNDPGAGDGNLLRRDNASELCTGCHALREHGSDTTTRSTARGPPSAATATRRTTRRTRCSSARKSGLRRSPGTRKRRR